jgi:hypothetical protein
MKEKEKLSGGSLCRDGCACSRVAAAFVSLHVTSYAESFATSWLRTSVRLFAGVTVAVDSQAAGSREGLVARGTHVTILGLGECRLAGGADVVVMLPRIGTSGCGAGDRNGQWHALRRVSRWERSLRIHA